MKTLGFSHRVNTRTAVNEIPQRHFISDFKTQRINIFTLQPAVI
jgi:hypothetical protein